MHAIFVRSSLINDCERSECRIIEIQYTSRPDDLWGHPEMEGTFRKWSYCFTRARFLKKSKNSPGNKVPRFKKIKTPPGKIWSGHDHVAVTKELIDRSPPLAEACAIRCTVIA